jgi:hypothetical protein
MGSASLPNMLFYRIDFGSGASPTSWSSIGQWSLPVAGGQLAAWNTIPLPAGPYTLRLTVQDPARGAVTSSVLVNVVH